MSDETSGRKFLMLAGCLLIFAASACQVVKDSSPDISIILPGTLTPANVIRSPIPPSQTPPVIPTFPAHPPLQPVDTPTPLPAPTQAAPATPQSRQALAHLSYPPWELVLGLAWSPDGRALAISAGEFIRLYETTGYQLIHTLETGVWSPALAFNPAGTHLASGGRDGNVSLWDVANGRLLFTFPAHKKGVNAVIFSPDGDLLATGGNDAVARLWDPVSGGNQGQMIGGTYAVPDIAFTPDGASLAVVNGDVVRLRDVASGRFVQTLRGQEFDLYRFDHLRWQASGNRRQPGNGDLVEYRIGSGRG